MLQFVSTMDGDTVDSEEMEQMPSSRPTLTSRSNAARQVAVNFMPSRQLPYSTLRLRRNNSEHNALLGELGEADDPDSASKQADIIVRELEQHQVLMEDNPVSEELRRGALRDLSQGMTMKRNVRAKLSASVSLRLKQRPISLFKRIKYRVSFAWKRSGERARDAMFSIELWYEAIRDIEGQFGSAVGSYFCMVRRLFVMNVALSALWLGFVVVPQALHNQAEPRSGSGGNWALDWITGKGGMQGSLMFYGHYHPGRVSPGGRYNMAFAYFFTALCSLLAFFALLCYKMADSYRRNFIETSGALSHVFANKVFCGWDFGVTAPRAANLNAHSIYNEFKELLNEQNKNKASLSFCARLGQCLTNITITGLVLGCIGGVLFGLWVLLEKKVWELQLSLLLTLIVAVCPALFHAVVRCEFYNPRTALYVTLARTWLLHIGVLLLLFLYWATRNKECWETRFGQEAYRLVLLDAVVSLLVLPAVETIRAFIYKLRPNGNAPEFNIAYNSLTLIYNQSVLWFGMLFSPLLVVVVAIKFLLLFYVKRACLLRACQPARKVWRGAQTQTVLYMLVTVSLFTTLFAIGSLFLKMPSLRCGPFRGYDYVYMVASEGVLHISERKVLEKIVTTVTRPAVIGFLMLLLCVCVYLAAARARAQRSMAALLRRMLRLQARDKDFLLTAIGKVSNGEWLYSPKAEEGPNSHTWRYLNEVRKPSNCSFHFDASRLSRSFTDRPRSYAKETRPTSNYAERPMSNDGDTDSSFSWQGSGNDLSTVESKGD